MDSRPDGESPDASASERRCMAVNIASVPSDDLSGPVSTVVVGRPWTTWLTLPLLPAMSSVPE